MERSNYCGKTRSYLNEETRQEAIILLIEGDMKQRGNKLCILKKETILLHTVLLHSSDSRNQYWI